MAPSIVTLTTDFGTSEPYVGVMKGVILGINGQASLVDLTHDVGAQSVFEGAILVGISYRYFPPQTIHVVVVDPGVGSSRRPILLETPHGRFVAPDNGVLSYVLKNCSASLPAEEASLVRVPRRCRAYHLTNPRYWLHPLSQTFHGRDIFAPVAGHLSLGVSPLDLGEKIGSLICLPIASPAWRGNRLEGKVLHVNRFGNLMTNLSSELLGPAVGLRVEVKGRCISGLSTHYGQGEGLLALIGSSNTLEVAVKNGSAARELGARAGDAVVVWRGPGS